MQQWIKLTARQLTLDFNLDKVDAIRIEKLLALLIKDLQQGLKVTAKDIWRMAVGIDGKPRCLSYNLFDAVNCLAKTLPAFKL